MRLEEAVGQQLLIGIPGRHLTEDVRAHLRTIRAGGWIPFARNFDNREQFLRLVGEMSTALGPSSLAMVDHEGGRVVRFSDGVTRFPDALTVGTQGRPADAYQQGRTEAEELAALGLQVNLAPCLDVLMPGADPVIGTRAYGADPHRVAEFGVERIRGLQERGVAACAKHFPGIGAVEKDPHAQLPTVDVDWAALRATHLLPFQAAIRAGVRSIMSSHVCYPALEGRPLVPATFSPRLIRTLLREELGYAGAVLTDDLEMGALRGLCSIGEAAVRAIEAGHDGLLVCSDPGLQREVYAAVLAAYRQGRLRDDQLAQSCERLRGLRPSLKPAAGVW